MGLFGKQDTSHWPTTFATIDEFGVGGTSVEASGAYTVDGEYYTVQLEREFHSVTEAERWAAELERNPKVAIRFNPDKPEKYEIL